MLPPLPRRSMGTGDPRFLFGKVSSLGFYLWDGFFRVAYLATPAHSGGNPEFRQDVCLKQHPSRYNQKQYPDAHTGSFLFLFNLFQYVLQKNYAFSTRLKKVIPLRKILRKTRRRKKRWRRCFPLKLHSRTKRWKEVCRFPHFHTTDTDPCPLLKCENREFQKHFRIFYIETHR